MTDKELITKDDDTVAPNALPSTRSVGPTKTSHTLASAAQSTVAKPSPGQVGKKDGKATILVDRRTTNEAYV